MITLEQAREYLESVGLALPDFVINLLLQSLGAVSDCLDEHYSSATQQLILLYLLSLMAYAQSDVVVASQTAPSGASQSFRHRSFGDRWRSVVSALQALDVHNCTGPLVPPDPGAGAGQAGLWVSTGGCGNV